VAYQPAAENDRGSTERRTAVLTADDHESETQQGDAGDAGLAERRPQFVSVHVGDCRRRRVKLAGSTGDDSVDEREPFDR